MNNNSNINMTALITLFAGFVLLYGAIRNKSPIEVIKNAITGKPPSAASPIGGTGPTGGTSGAPGTGTGTGGAGGTP